MSAAAGLLISSYSGSATSTLLDRLHTLLSNLNDTTEIIKTWPEPKEGEDVTKVHYESTSELIESIHEIVRSIKTVENMALRRTQADQGEKLADPTASKEVLDAPVPLDLLDLMDYGNGLNPECFFKALIREALRHLSGLRRRKVALEMLGCAIELGMKERDDKKRQKDRTGNADCVQSVAEESFPLDGKPEEQRGIKRPRDNSDADLP